MLIMRFCQLRRRIISPKTAIPSPISTNVTIMAWIDDESPDMDKTIAVLDRALARGESLTGLAIEFCHNISFAMSKNICIFQNICLVCPVSIKNVLCLERKNMGQRWTFWKSKKEIRKDFKRAAESGAGYLLLLTDALEDYHCSSEREYTSSVADTSEIVPLLRKEQEANPNSIVSLSGVYDLSEKFKEQHSLSKREQIAKLPVAIQMDLAHYQNRVNELTKHYEEKKNLARAQQEWAWRPWYQRLVIAKPR